MSRSTPKKPYKPDRRLAVTPLDLLLPYQRAWVQDKARFKIWLKSRQIGGSLAASFEVVADAIETGGDWVKLAATVSTVGAFLQTTADGRVQTDAGTGARTLVAQALETGVTGELVEAILIAPQSLT